MNLGLKCSIATEQFYDRIQRNPNILELHLNEGDVFGENLKLLEQRIQDCKDRDIEVYIHHPLKYRGQANNMFGGGSERGKYYELSTEILAGVCVRYDIKCVIHPLYSDNNIPEYTDEVIDKIKEEIIKYRKLSGDRFLWENATRGVYSYENPRLMDDIIVPLNLNTCFDISHAFISYKGDNDKLIATMEKMKPYTKYYHVVDSMGEKHDSIELGKGKIDWERVKPYIEAGIDYIYEINLKNQEDCTEMVESHNYLKTLVNDNK